MQPDPAEVVNPTRQARENVAARMLARPDVTDAERTAVADILAGPPRWLGWGMAHEYRRLTVGKEG